MTDTTPKPNPPDDFYRLLCEHAAVALVATDASFNIVSWNRAAADLLGRTSREMLGKDVLEAVPPARRKLMDRLLRRTARCGQTSQFQIRMNAPAGPRHLTVVLSPIPGPDGASRGAAAWIVDETHGKELAERLNQAERMALAGTLAGGVAHNFNNILGGVATFVDFALTSGDTVAMKRALQMTSEAAARAAKITQSLLCFAEHKAGGSDLADLTEVVLTFVHLVERPLAKRKIDLRLDLHPAPVIPVEAVRMHQVLGNLLSNAEDAMPEGGTITVAIDCKGPSVLLTFADTGSGIKPEHLPLVFEPFFTTKGLLSGGQKANPGLGLSVVHGIVLEMGATIEVSPHPGQGAKFTIAFPAPRGG